MYLDTHVNTQRRCISWKRFSCRELETWPQWLKQKGLLFLPGQGAARRAVQSWHSAEWPSGTQAAHAPFHPAVLRALAFIPPACCLTITRWATVPTSFPPASHQERCQESKNLPIYAQPGTEPHAGATPRSPLCPRPRLSGEGRKGKQYGGKQTFLMQKGRVSAWPGRASPWRGVDFLFI